MLTVCTYFDRAYLARGLALRESLIEHHGDIALWVLCLDEETHAVLSSLALSGVQLVPLAELEHADAELAATKGTRSRVEYYFTCTPAWCAFVVDRLAPGDVLLYADADIRFYDDAAAVVDALGDGCVGIIPHRFPESYRHLEKHGVFNVGVLAFRNTPDAMRVVQDWRAKCLEWCSDREDGDRFADQKYLDAWPARFSCVRVIAHPGIGLGPWNWMRHTIDLSQRPPLIDGQPLVFFHFHAFRMLDGGFYDRGTLGSEIRMPKALRLFLYDQYVLRLRALETTAGREVPFTAAGHARVSVWRFLRRLARSTLSGRRTLYRVSARAMRLDGGPAIAPALR